MSHRQASVNGYESNKEWSAVQHVESYLNIVNDIPHRSEGEGILLEYVPLNAKRILDPGTGDGRLVSAVNPISFSLSDKRSFKLAAYDRSFIIIFHMVRSPFAFKHYRILYF